MAGRYGRSEGTTRRAGRTAARPPYGLRIAGVLAGTALIAGGALAVMGGDTRHASADLAAAETPGSDAADPALREQDDVSRSNPRRPAGESGSLGKPVPDTPSFDAQVVTTAGDELGGGSSEDDDPDAKPEATAPLPDDSGSGRRIVFDITQQQVWLVEEGDEVDHTYLVSGSRYDQLPEGTYEVFSKSEDAVSWTYAETMRYMVRFHRGENSNIGFHDIPIYRDSGEEVQTLSELGTALSDGCIRQDHEDAKALWDFAPVGTTVVVVRT